MHFCSDKFTDDITPMVKHICTNGNSTVYQWKHGALPDKVLKDDIPLTTTTTTNTEEVCFH